MHIQFTVQVTRDIVFYLTDLDRIKGMEKNSTAGLVWSRIKVVFHASFRMRAECISNLYRMRGGSNFQQIDWNILDSSRQAASLPEGIL